MKIKITNCPTMEWNNTILKAKDGNIFQSTHYPNLRKIWNQKPYFMTAYEGKKIKGLMVILEGNPVQDILVRFPLSKITNNLARFFLKSISSIYGPIVFDKKNRDVIFKQMFIAFCRFAKKRHASAIDFIPPLAYLSKNRFDLAGFMRKHNFDIDQKIGTFFVDLTQDQEQLWRNLKKNARNGVNRTLKQGVTVREVKTLRDLKQYYTVYIETEKRNGRSPSPFERLYNIWAELQPNGLKIFLAEHNKKTVSGIGVTIFNGILYQFGVTHSAYGKLKKIYGNDLLEWEIIKWGHKKNYRFYDLAGVMFDNNPKHKGILNFKKRWGGKLVRQNRYRYTRTLLKLIKCQINTKKQ